MTRARDEEAIPARPERPLAEERPEAAFSHLLCTAFRTERDVMIMPNEPIIEKICARLPGLRGEIYRAVPDKKHRHGLGLGSPDLLLIVRGYALFLELKSAKGVVKIHQRAWHDAARFHGVRVEVIKLDADTYEGAARSIAKVRAMVDEIRGWFDGALARSAGEAVELVSAARGDQ